MQDALDAAGGPSGHASRLVCAALAAVCVGTSGCVGLVTSNWGPSAVQDIKAADVHLVRLDWNKAGSQQVTAFTSQGFAVDLCLCGPFNTGGVSALDQDQWIQDALAYYAVDPDHIPMVEVLNEPGGTWFWGPNALSQANADAYRALVAKTYLAFHAAYGSQAPLILASVDGAYDRSYGELTWMHRWWTSGSAYFVDGVTVHPYGGTDDITKSALGDRQRVSDAHAYTGKDVYITEIGWPTATGQSPTSNSLQWSESDQAINLTNFIDWADTTGYVPLVMYFNYRDYGTNDWYGITRSDGSHKPAYYFLKAEADKSLSSLSGER